MIGSLKGIVEGIHGPVLTIDVQGVGYEVICSSHAIAKLSIGQPAKVVVYTDVREDSIRLYGFEDHVEKQAFLLLLRVKGVGAKTASDILSKVDKKELLRLIGSADVGKLQAVRGIGKKTAERIIVELSDKVGSFALEDVDSGFDGGGAPSDDAVLALQALGFSRRDAELAVKRAGENFNTKGLASGDIVREALRFI